MRLEHLGLVDPPAGAVARAVHGADRCSAYVSFSDAAGHALPQHRRADRAGTRRTSRARRRPSSRAQVTKKVEDAVAGVTGVKHIISTVTDGSSVDDHRVPPRDQPGPRPQRRQGRDRQASAPTCRAPSTSRSSTRIDDRGPADRDLRGPRAGHDARRSCPGSSTTSIMRAAAGREGRRRRSSAIGGVDREIRIALDPDRLLALGITAGDVNRQLRATNVDLAGGRGEIGGREQAIRTLAGKHVGRGPRRDHDRAARRPQGAPRPARHASTDGTAEPRTFARARRRAGRRLRHLPRQGRERRWSVAADVAKKVDGAAASATPTSSSSRSTTTVAYTLGTYHSTMKTLIEGAVLAISWCFIFLRDWRATLIAAIALPLSIIPTFWAMELLGFSLNLVSLLAHHARHRHPGRRRHRRDREHRAPHAHGQIALPRRAGGRRRDRPRRHRHHLDHHRGVRAGVASWAASPGSTSSSSA